LFALDLVGESLEKGEGDLERRDDFEFDNDYPFSLAIEEVLKGSFLLILLSLPCDILLAEMSRYFLFELIRGLLLLEFRKNDFYEDFCNLLWLIPW
jgi:hypothetical protein